MKQPHSVKCSVSARDRLERLPAREAMLPGNQFLRITEPEARREDFATVQAPVARQNRPDLRRDWVVPVAMPTQHKLGLIPEVLGIGHGRIAVKIG